MDIPEIHVKVLYDFDYTTKEGRRVWVKEGERLFLIKKTNSDWWQVIRTGERRPFYVPATYVEEVRKSKDGKRGFGQKYKKDEHAILMLKIGDNSSDERNGYLQVDNQLNNKSDIQFENITFRPRSNSDLAPCQLNDQTNIVDRSAARKSPQIVHSQSTIFRNELNPILLDKRKSWAVEELVTELAQMRAKNEKEHQQSDIEKSDIPSKNSANGSVPMNNGTNEPVVRSHSVAVNGNKECFDKVGNIEIRKERNSLSNGDRIDTQLLPEQSPSCRAVKSVSPQQCSREKDDDDNSSKSAPDKRPRVKLGPKVKQLSESLDFLHGDDKSPPYKFAQQLHFPSKGDKKSSNTRKKSEDSVSSSEGTTGPNKMFKRFRERARSSSSNTESKSKGKLSSTPEKKSVNRSKDSLTESNYSSSSSESGFKERNRSEERKLGEGGPKMAATTTALAFQNRLYCPGDSGGSPPVGDNLSEVVEVNVSGGAYVLNKSRTHSEETTDSQPMTEGEADYSDSEVSNKSDDAVLSKSKKESQKRAQKTDQKKTDKKSVSHKSYFPFV